MIKLQNSDLKYLLRQVNIGNDYSQFASPLDPLGVREVDGGNNNLVGGYDADGNWVPGTSIHPDWGQADQPFPRIFYTDTPGGPAYGYTYDPNTVAVADAAGNPPTIDDPAHLGTLIINPAWVPTFDSSGMVSTDLGTSARTITQLISSSDIDPESPTYNPAAVAAMEALGGQPVDTANTVVGSTATAALPDPGILGGVPFNEWNVAFGQFFDHGLDFIQKSGGFVMITLSPSDPLYDDSKPPEANVMMLARGTLANPSSDFETDNAGNVTLKAGVMPVFDNNTGLLIDQSQTYGSHTAINVLVREYDDAGNFTGKLITNAEDLPGPGDLGYDAAAYEKASHDLGTWADMKVNAARIGIGLVDMDVLDAPSIKADALGKISFTPLNMTYNDGMAVVPALYLTSETIADMAARTGIAESVLMDHDPFVRGADGSVVLSNQAILSDIRFGANPAQGPYDPALLDAHYVSGDHRVNENVGLTAVHHVFHEEHNIEVDQIKIAAIRDALADSVDGNGFLVDYVDPATGDMVDGYLVDTDLSALAGLSGASTDAEILAAADDLNWNTEFLYQAARIITESEYNHIAIDQYVGGLVALPEFVSYSSDVNMSVTLEFAQAIFRLGHSQLNETIQVAVPDGDGNEPSTPGWTPTYVDVDLFDAFLNPEMYGDLGPANITLGLLNQQANQIDEFVTSALQQSLVGIGLDLPALNITRGRDVGLPTLNEMRQQIFEGLGQNTSNGVSASLAPYTSWEDFGGHLRYAESLANFIAAYGRDNATYHLQELRVAYEAGTDVSDGAHALHGYDLDGDGVIGLQDMRANAQAIVDAAAEGDSDATMFMRGSGQPFYNETTQQWEINTGTGGDQGFWDVDLWVGGLAEQPLFDGPLGTTFTMIMADFGQKMQDGDRFYYLYRMPVGHHLGDQIIGEQFADLIMRTTGLEHIGDAFGYQSGSFILDGTDGPGSNYNENPYDGVGTGGDTANDYFNAIYMNLPDSVRAFVVANSSFEDNNLASDGVGGVVNENVAGNYTVANAPNPGDGLPAGWSLTGGTGGVFAPTRPDDPVNGASAPIMANGHDGGKVAWLSTGTVLSQDTGQAVVAGDTYTITVNLGNRSDQAGGFAATVQLVDSAGHVIAEVLVTEAEVPNGQWMPISISGLADGTNSAGTVNVRVLNTGAEQVLVDNVHVTQSEPGGSANDGHIVISGLSGNDYLVGALGDDYLYGDDGDDILEGAQGNDHLYGGDGNDHITDYENDDFAHGGAGNDYINLGPGVLDTAHGGDGNDEVHGGDGVDEVYGDDGDDMLYGDGDTDLIIGGDGNDFMDGGDSVDEMFAGNGNDWLRGGVGDDHLNGGSGNDLLEGGMGPAANDGDRLFGDQAPGTLPVIEFNGDGSIGNMDIASYENAMLAVFASLQTLNGNGTNSNFLDSYAYVDGLVGSTQGDRLEGGSLDAVATNGWNNQLIGGGGDDTLIGGGDDGGVVPGDPTLRMDPTDIDPGHYVDWLFGDAVITRNDLWVDLEATLFYNANKAGIDNGTITSGGGVTFLPDWGAKDIGVTSSNTTTGEMRVVFDDTAELGHILGEDGAVGNNDKAIYRGNLADYLIEQVLVAGQVAIRITDLRDPATTDNHDGVDMLVGVEWAEFADGAVVDITPKELEAGNDTIVTNWDGTAFTVPEWALMANDHAAMGGALDITGIPSASSLVVQLASGNRISIDDANNANGGTFTYTLSESGGGTTAGNVTVNNQNVSVTPSTVVGDVLNGTAASEIIVGNGRGYRNQSGDTITGHGGDDIIFANGGNDIIHWAVGDGSDYVDGGTNRAKGDRFVVTGNASAETFVIYSNMDGSAAAAGFTGLRPATEIIVTRNGELIAQLVHIEEITINTLDVTANDGGGLNTGPTGGDTVAVVGDFTATSLKYSTITINGGEDDDTVDITGLKSEHRVVFHANGGDDQIIGDKRPQDQMDNIGGPANGGDSDDDDEDDDDNTNRAPTSSAPVTLPPLNVNASMVITLAMLVGNSMDDDGDMLSVTDLTASSGQIEEGPHEGEWTFTPAPDHDGPVSFSYRVSDGQASSPQTAGLNMVPTDQTLVGDDAGNILVGGGGNDTVLAAGGNDTIVGGAGNDAIFAGDGDDTVLGGAGDDTIDGGAGNDMIDAGAGDDLVFGGAGNDTLLGGDGEDVLFGNGGADVILGGDGNDRIEGGRGSDLAHGGEGDDTFFVTVGDGSGDRYFGDVGSDTLDFSALSSDAVVRLDLGIISSAQSGNDQIADIENVVGGSGNDEIHASAVVNIMDGGDGDDTFVFGSAAAADGDSILNFEPGDVVDLSGIDANTLLDGVQSFVLFAGGVFSSAGQLMITHELRSDGDHTLLAGNTDDDLDAEFNIDVAGNHTFTFGNGGNLIG